jgi:hypothetical protein
LGMISSASAGYQFMFKSGLWPVSQWTHCVTMCKYWCLLNNVALNQTSPLLPIGQLQEICSFTSY